MNKTSQLSNTVSHFDDWELFFSRTKRNGVIVSGNSVFARVSKYPIGEMIDRAHSLVRHDDMPRAAFKLMWDEILKGHHFTAYVKNKASDGSYYWVLASVCPLENDFVSISIKPSSDFFHNNIENLYRELKSLEQSKTLDEQVAFLIEAIKKLGFEDYSSFMRTALDQELSQIHKNVLSLKNKSSFADYIMQMQLTLTDLLVEFKNTSKGIVELQKTFTELKKVAQAQELLPFNLTLSTQKSNVTQKTMEILSGLFAQQQKEVISFMNDFQSVIEDAESKGLGPVRYDVSLCFLQATMVGQFLEEIENHQVDSQFKMSSDKSYRESRDLNILSQSQFEKTLININELRSRFIKILSKKEEMETLVKSILSIAQLGQVEISQDSSAKGAALPHLVEMKKMAEVLNQKISDIGIQLKLSSQSLDSTSRSLIRVNKKCVQLQIQIERSLNSAKKVA